MEEAIARGEFIETARVHTNIYGTSYAAVQKVSSKGKICILDIDIQGVQSVKKSGMESKFIFILPPSMEELEKRLRGRATESDDMVKVRLETAIKEIEFGKSAGNFDAIIVNDDVERAYEELRSTLQTFYPGFDFSSK